MLKSANRLTLGEILIPGFIAPPFIMAPTTLRAGLRYRLLQQLASRRHPSRSALSQGFTLIELLVVVIIVAILASASIPGFLSQAEKSKAAVAKSLVSSATKECQVYLVEATGQYTQQTVGTQEITLSGNTCNAGANSTWTATVQPGGTSSFTSTLNPSSGITKTCTGTVGCNAGTW